MPNRILKDSVRTSKKVNELSDFNYRVWSYLITYVDDYGRGSADPELLKGLVFPRRKGLTETQIAKALDDLANAGMIKLYEVEGESYLYFPNWDRHQQIRAKKSKFPAPPSVCNHLKSSDCKCPRNPIQSNPNPIQDRGGSSCARTREDGDPELARVMSFYMDRLNPTPSSTVIDELTDYAGRLGADVVIHALEISLDEHKTGWSYSRAILQRYHREGLTTLNAVLEDEQNRHREKQTRPGAGKKNLTFWDVAEEMKK